MEDFIRVMDENPSWLEAVRSRVLTRELIEFPARFAEYARVNDERMSTFEVRMDAFDARMDAFEVRMDAFDRKLAAFMEATEREFQSIREQFAVVNARLDAFDREFQSIREQFAIVNARLDALDRRMGRFEQDMARFRARHASEIVRDQSEIVADNLDCEKVKTLSAGDLIAMSRAADTEGIPVNDLRSFRRADLVMEAVRRDTGEGCYIAVEISYTVNGRDTSRAIRNAGFLRRFTGKDALAAVAGVRKDARVDEDIAANGVAWYELDEEDLGTG